MTILFRTPGQLLKLVRELKRDGSTVEIGPDGTIRVIPTQPEPADEHARKCARNLRKRSATGLDLCDASLYMYMYRKGYAEMTDQMKKMLTLACGNIGVAGSGLTFEAQKLGWVVYFKTPQNSTTARYKITESGRAALEAVGA